MTKKINLLGIEFNAVSRAEFLSIISTCIENKIGGRVVTPNLNFYSKSRVDPNLLRLINSHDLVVCDSQWLLWLSRLFSIGIPEKISGSDLLPEILKIAESKKWKIAFIGGTEHTEHKLLLKLSKEHPDIDVVFVYSGILMQHPDKLMVEELTNKIISQKPDLIFVGLGFPKQEQWADALIASCKSSWFINIGMGINFYSGSVRQSPQILKKAGLEWLWRLFSEPKRLFRRYVLEDIPQLIRMFHALLNKGLK